MVEDPEAYFTNGYGIYFRSPAAKDSKSFSGNLLSRVENIDVVQKILNSTIMDYYVRKTSVSIEGGYPCYQKNFIAKFTIPEFSEAEIEQLRALNEAAEINNYLLEEYIYGFAALNKRSTQGDDFFKYERVALLVVDFCQNPVKVYESVDELKKDGMLPAKSGCSLEGMTYQGFTEDLLSVYDKRFGRGKLS